MRGEHDFSHAELLSSTDHLNLGVHKISVMFDQGLHHMLYVQHEINEYVNLCHHHMVSVRDIIFFFNHVSDVCKVMDVHNLISTENNSGKCDMVSSDYTRHLGPHAVAMTWHQGQQNIIILQQEFGAVMMIYHHHVTNVCARMLFSCAASG